jgi:hypothetical protein
VSVQKVSRGFLLTRRGKGTADAEDERFVSGLFLDKEITPRILEEPLEPFPSPFNDHVPFYTVS